MKEEWSNCDIPSLTGKVCLVTGANAGIGYATSLALAEKGATVVMGCRNGEKAELSARRIRERIPTADVRTGHLDLANLVSLRSFADQMANEYGRLDLLVNNAGVMMPPLGRTKDGFETQIGANYLGHFALTALLLPLMRNTSTARVVTLSSIAQRFGRIDFQNFNAQRRYSPWGAYAQSKLACLIFAIELHRRLSTANSTIISLAAHPGATKSELGRYRADLRFVERLFAQETENGAMPSLRAATDLTLRGGEYIGPSGLFRTRGRPIIEKPGAAAVDPHTAKRLWTISEEMTGCQFEF